MILFIFKKERNSPIHRGEVTIKNNNETLKKNKEALNFQYTNLIPLKTEK